MAFLFRGLEWRFSHLLPKFTMDSRLIALDCTASTAKMWEDREHTHIGSTD